MSSIKISTYLENKYDKHDLAMDTTQRMLGFLGLGEDDLSEIFSLDEDYLQNLLDIEKKSRRII